MTINKHDELEARFEGLSRALDSSRRTTRIALAASVVALAIGGVGTLNAFDLGMAPQDRSVNGLPLVLPYQGTLSKAGAPFTGTQAMQFKLYSDTSGAAFWTSDPRDVDVVGGKFAVTLGDANDANKLEAQDFRHSELYVELVVDGTTLSPMQRIAPAPQAVTAAQAAGDFTIPGELRTDNATVNNALNVAGDVTLGDANTDTTTITGNVSVSGQLQAARRVVSPHPNRPGNGSVTSVNGVLCGETGDTDGSVVYPLNSPNPTLTGRAAVKQLCEDACGSPTAHMCGADELVTSASIGVRMPVSTQRAWYSSGVFSYTYNGASYFHASDCEGWTAEGTYVPAPHVTNQAPVWLNDQQEAWGAWDSCDLIRPIACCD